MKKTEVPIALIISAFPGCGKSYCFNHYQDRFTMLDSDSSQFSWVKDENGNNTKIRNPDFPANYITHIKENRDKADIIFVSTHDVVCKALQKANLFYYSVFPVNTPENKAEYLKRYIDRGSPKEFVDLMDKNWDSFLAGLEHNSYPIHLTLGQTVGPKYITDKMLQRLIYANLVERPIDEILKIYV